MKIDLVNQWLTAIQSVAVIVGVGVAAWQLFELSLLRKRLRARDLGRLHCFSHKQQANATGDAYCNPTRERLKNI
jgi:hypothetical protein